MSDLPPIQGRAALDTTEFKAALTELNRDLRVIESGFKATAAALDDWTKDASGLEARITSLTDAIGVQQTKVDLLHQQYEAVAAAQGEDSRAAEELQIKLNKETETLGKMQSELRTNEQRLQDFGDAEEAAGNKADGAVVAVDGLNVGMVNLSSTIDVAKAGIGIAIDVIGGMVNAVVGLGKAIVGLVLDTSEAGAELYDLSLKTGISTDRLQEMAYVGAQVGTSADTMTGAMTRLTRSMATAQQEATDFSAGTTEAMGDAAAEATKIEEEFAGKSAKIQNKLIDAEKSLGNERVNAREKYSVALAKLMQNEIDDLTKLQEQYLDKVSKINASIAAVSADYEYDKSERAEDTERDITRMTEDYNHDRENLVKELAAAETETEKARIQARIDEMDYEYNTRKKRREEDAAEAESDAEYQKNAKLKALQEQLDAEKALWQKQAAERNALNKIAMDELEARYQEELTAAEERYQGEVVTANQALAQIAIDRDKALGGIEQAAAKVGDMQAAFDRLGVSVVDSNGKLRDNEAVFSDLLTALGQVPNEAERDALAMQLFGKSAQELNPLIKAGADEIARLAEEAHKIGAVWSPEQIQAMADFQDALNSLKAGFMGLKGTLASTGFLAAFQGIANTLKDVMANPKVQDGIKQLADRIGQLAQQFADFVASDEFSAWIDQVINWLLNDLPKAIQEASRMWQEDLAPTVKELAAFMRDDFLPIAREVGAFLSDVLPPAISAISTVLDVLLAGWKAQWWFLDTFILPIFRNIGDTFENLRKLWDLFGEKLLAGMERLSALTGGFGGLDAGAGGGNRTTNTNNYNVTVQNSPQTTGSVLQDIRLLQMLYGGTP